MKLVLIVLSTSVRFRPTSYEESGKQSCSQHRMKTVSSNSLQNISTSSLMLLWKPVQVLLICIVMSASVRELVRRHV